VTSSTVRLFILQFLIATLIFLAHYFIVGQAVYGDGRIYYAYAVSLYFDHDLDTRNQLPQLPELSNPSHPIGSGLAYLPPLILANFVSNLFSLHLPPLSHLYQITTGLYLVFLSSIGLYLTYRTLTRFFSATTSLLALTTLWLTTNLFFYTAIDLLNSHPVSFFLASLTLNIATSKKITNKHVYLIALLTGFATSVRDQDIISYLPLLFLSLYKLNYVTKLKNMIFPTSLSLLLIFVGLLPQTIFRLTYHHQLTSAWLSPTNWDIFHPKIINLLVGPERGLLFYSPLIYAALWGLSKWKHQLAKVGTITFTLQFLLISVWWAWHQGASYGIRMLISTYPLISLGMGYFFSRLSVNFSKLLIIFFTILNLSTILCFLLFTTP